MIRLAPVLFLVACTRTPVAFTSHPFDGAKAGEARTISGVKFRWCPAERFTMGSPPSEPERRPGEDQVEVTLTKGFWIAQFETTQAEWRRIVGDFPGQYTAGLPRRSSEGAKAGEGPDFPVYDITFAQAEDFCRRMTAIARDTKELPADWEIRLPTEAQWEYACRAGTTTATAFGDSLSSTQANFEGAPYNGGKPGPSLKRTCPVGSYPPNPWGLHDMHGNVFEWCRDWSHASLPGGVDPDLHDKRRLRASEGGASASQAARSRRRRSAFRLQFEPERHHDHIGFRVVAVRP